MIAHSMGCTMGLYFLNQQTQAWKDKYIKSFVTLAGPWGGSVESLEVFAVGTDLIPGQNLPILKDAVRYVERTQPSLAWMMPSPLFFDGDVLVVTTSYNYSTFNIGKFFKLLDVPNMAMMYEDTQGLLADLPNPGVEVSLS